MGQLKTATHDCDGVSVICTQHPPRRALRLFWRLGKVAPYAIAHFDPVKWRGGDRMAVLAPMLLEMFERISVDEADEISAEILASCEAKIDGRLVSLSTPGNVDLVFAGNLGAMVGALAFALETNFGNFTESALPGKSSAPGSPQAEGNAASPST